MPRFFFDVQDGKGFHEDNIGDVFENLEDAVAQAQCILPAIAREEMPDGDHHDFKCDVRDDASRIVYRGNLSYRGTRGVLH
jgi:hypothetical protein